MYLETDLHKYVPRYALVRLRKFKFGRVTYMCTIRISGVLTEQT